MAALRQKVLLPHEGAAATHTPRVRGGKGAHLAEMASLGLPVPPFFTVPTGVCRAYQEHRRLPNNFWWHLRRGIAALEKATGRGFGCPLNPLLVSVRSGAPESMPGMMDTILNVGITSETRYALARIAGKRFSRNVHQRFREQYGREIDPSQFSHQAPAGFPDTEPWQQLVNSIVAVMNSWCSDRAIAYRDARDIPHWTGTAVNVQAMVFGNIDDHSGTGVVFSSDPSTGLPGMTGEWLQRAQGEDIVSGSCTPEPVSKLRDQMPDAYAELKAHADTLAGHLGAVADVEFTVESGQLYILQCRRAKLTPLAAATQAVRAVWAKRLTKEQAITSLTTSETAALKSTAFSEEDVYRAIGHRQLVATGLSASPGAVTGYAAFSSAAALDMAAEGKTPVLLRPDTSPEDLRGMLASVAVVTQVGGATCHAAVVARSEGIPTIVGTGRHAVTIREGDPVSVDANRGLLLLGSLPVHQTHLPKEANIFLRWVAKQPHAPRVDFSLLKRRYNVNRVLNDFYLTDRMALSAARTSLECDAVRLRREVHDHAAVLMATYLAICVGRELRHYKWGWERLDLGEGAADDFIRAITVGGFSRNEAMRFTAEKLEAFSHDELVRFVTLAVTAFLDSVWASNYGGFGGKPWASIASALLGYLDGSMGPTTFADHAFDLRHHGGVLFNKHDMVSDLTNEEFLQLQLDVKKTAKDIGFLYQGLMQLHQERLRFTSNPELAQALSPEVANVWETGKAQGLW